MKIIIFLIVALIVLSCSTHLTQEEEEILNKAFKDSEHFFDILTPHFQECYGYIPPHDSLDQKAIIEYISIHNFKIDYTDMRVSVPNEAKKSEPEELYLIYKDNTTYDNRSVYFTIYLKRRGQFWCINRFFTYNVLTAKYFGDMD